MVSVSSASRFSILRSHHPVGASTGYMHELRGDWQAQVDQAWRLSPFAIELSALAEQELDNLAGYLASGPRLPFRYLSIHGPSKGRALPEPALARKKGGRIVDELAPWFAELPEAGFCFDIAHAWSIDETMSAGADLLDAFRPRLRHLHVSSLSPELHHLPLTEEHEELSMPLLRRCRDVPWILEAPPRDP